MKKAGFNSLIALLLAAALMTVPLSACKKLDYEGGKPANTAEVGTENNGESEPSGTDNCGYDGGNLKPGENIDDGTGSRIRGTTMNYGIFTGLFVPESMDFVAGTLVNPESPEGFCLIDINDPTKTIRFGTSPDPEADVDEAVESNAEDEPQDIEFELNGNIWKGCFYRHNGLDVFLIYTTINGHVVTSESTGYPIDGELAKAVLASIKLG